MKHEDRQSIAKDLFQDVIFLGDVKGKAYAGEGDAFANFKRNAESLGLTKYQVWGVYAGKHWDAITNSIKKNPSAPLEQTEGMRGRITDMITYLTILYGMMIEDGQSTP